MKPLAIDLFCGVGGFSEGALLEGYDCIGFDIEHHSYGEHRYPGQLVIQDVLTLHGSQFKTAAVIWASPPCQAYSYMAMPWKLAKAKAAAIRSDTTGQSLADLNQLFDACFRIQKEASIAAGRHIPMVVENVRGAIPWVGRSRWNFGSFHLWGDVPALMPVTFKGFKSSGMNWSDRTKRGQDFTRIAGKQWSAENEVVRKLDPLVDAEVSVSELSSPDSRACRGLPEIPLDGLKGVGPKWDPATKSGAHGMARWTNPTEGVKVGNDWFGAGNNCSPMRQHHSKSPNRKMASAMIAKIPLPLSRHIAITYRP